MAGQAHSLEGDGPEYQDRTPVIECPHSVLDAIRTSVLDGFNSNAHGGAEMYGVLLGAHSGNEVRIAAFCTVIFESANAGSKPLSAEQQAAFAEAMREPDTAADGTALLPVGCFRSHPQSEETLSPLDLEIFNTFFPRLEDVVMILRPGNSVPTLVRFYFRKSQGALTAGSPFQEFSVPLGLEEPAPVDFEPADLEQAPPSIEAPRGESGDQLEIFRAANTLLVPPAPAARRQISLTTPLLVAAIAGLATAFYWLTRPPQRLELRLFDTAGQLRIIWDPVRQARTGFLDINDGEAKTWIELDPEQLRSGNYTYTRQSGTVTVHMAVERPDNETLSEMASFLRTGGQVPDVLSARAQPPAITSRDRFEPPTVESSVPVKPAELVVPVLVERAKTRPKFKAPVLPVSSPALAVKQNSDLAPPPVLAHQTQPASIPTPPHAEPAPPKAVPPAPVAEPARKPVAVVRAAPVSGRIIWIGRLQKNQPLSIDGKTCSTGSMIGELPDKPIKFSVSPGDLSNDGMVLYTANPQYANSVIESPSAQNGWNKTVYTWNPKFANDVAVEEAPSAQNRWDRLVLRSKSPRISVVVIDWSVTP